MARYEARVLEGGEASTALVPLCTILEFPKVNDGKTINEAISSGADFTAWEPWVVWHTMTKRGTPKEERSFEEWCDAVDWCGIYNASDALDPSGGEDTQTPESSPASSSTPTAGPSSSTSTTTSSEPSGTSSVEPPQAPPWPPS